jgi:hypothetical protein
VILGAAIWTIRRRHGRGAAVTPAK